MDVKPLACALKDANALSVMTFEEVREAREALWDACVLRGPRLSAARREGTIGGALDRLAAMEKGLSAEQRELSRIDLKGYPRLVRGVAGSGKSIVLANMAARFLFRRSRADSPIGPAGGGGRVAVVCFNRALVPFLRAKIGAALEGLAGEAGVGLTGNLTVTHLNHLVYELCSLSQGAIRYLSVRENEACDRARRYLDMIAAFERSPPARLEALRFDAVFVDEGQDLAPEEFILVHEMCRRDPATGEKNLVIFYDDAQNLYARPRPIWKALGIDVQRGDRSRVMRRCFRNPQAVVEFAFNLLLGKQAADSGAVRTRTFADVAWLGRHDLIEERPTHFRVKFTDRAGDRPAVTLFRTRDHEKRWVAAEILRLIREEEVRPEEILVVFDREGDFGSLEALIRSLDGNGVIQGVVRPYNGNRSDQDRLIFRENHLTLATTKGAKGYDAPIVFLCGADSFAADSAGRASFYVGATRTRFRLYVTGLDTPGRLAREAAAVEKILGARTPAVGP